MKSYIADIDAAEAYLKEAYAEALAGPDNVDNRSTIANIPNILISLDDGTISQHSADFSNVGREPMFAIMDMDTDLPSIMAASEVLAPEQYQLGLLFCTPSLSTGIFLNTLILDFEKTVEILMANMPDEIKASLKQVGDAEYVIDKNDPA